MQGIICIHCPSMISQSYLYEDAHYFIQFGYLVGLQLAVLKVNISHGLVHDLWLHESFRKMLSLTTENLFFFRLKVYHNKCTFQNYLPLLYHLSFVWKEFITQIYQNALFCRKKCKTHINTLRLHLLSHRDIGVQIN